mgnify:CR=1 FL=1
MSGAKQIPARDLDCSKCKKTFKFYLASYSYTLICPHCGAVYENYEGTVLPTSSKLKNTFSPSLPVGTAGSIKGKQYLIISASSKKEKGTSYFWEEYTLFNPIYGYAYLAQYNGHWTILEQINDAPIKEKGKTSYTYQGSEFELFAKYTSQLMHAAGEFPFKVDFSDHSVVEEYVCPPYILSCEKTSTDFVWFKGEYVTADDIRTGLKVTNLPARIGIGAAEPFYSSINGEAFKKVCIAIAVIFTVLQLYFSATCHDETAFIKMYSIADSLNNKEINTESFDLKYGTKNVDIKLREVLLIDFNKCNRIFF